MLVEDKNNNTEKTKNKLKQETQEVQNIYTIELTNIFSALHKKAIENAEKAVSNCTILNTALDGKGANAKFSGPGQHLIMALVKNDNDTMSKDDALLAIKTYVQWFSGPENSEKITINDIKPQFVDKSDDEKNNPDKSSSNKETEIASEETNSENKENKENKENNKTKNESKKLKSFLNFLFESTQEEDEALAEENNQKIAGYYIEYEVEIGNDRGSSLDSAWKKIGKWADGIEFGAESLFGGRSDVKMSAGDMKKAFSKKIDAEALTTAVSKQFKAKFPQLEKTQFSVFDTKTLINKLNSRLTAAIKSALKQVKNALCIRVNKTSDSYELISKQEIADLVTKSMKSSDKLFGNKNQVNKNDVYLVNNYDENKKEQKKVAEPVKKESVIIKSLLKKIFEDILIEEEPEENNKNTDNEKNQINTKESSEKLIDDISKEIKNVADNEIKTAQLPFDVEDKETKVWNIKDLIKQLKDNKVNDSNSISKLEKYENALVVKLSKTVGNQDNKGDAIEDRSEEPDQLGTGESLTTNIYNKLLMEDVPTEQIKKQLLDVGKKIFDKIVNKFKDNLTENDSNEIINVEYENPTESIKTLSFSDFIFEKSNKDKSRDHITNDQAKELISIIKQKGLKNIQKNFDKVEKKWSETKQGQTTFSFDKYEPIHKDVEAMLKDEADNAEEKIITYINSAIHDKSDNAKKKKIVLTRLIPAIKNLTDDNTANEEKIKITFRDIDDPSQIDDFTSLTSQDKEKYKQFGDPVEVTPGEDFDIPEVDEKKGYRFDRWDPDPKEMKESGYTYAIYQELNEEQEDEFEEDNSIKPFQYLILPKTFKYNENNNVINSKDINKTEWDCYIIPMKNLEFISAKEDAEKGKA